MINIYYINKCSRGEIFQLQFTEKVISAQEGSVQKYMLVYSCLILIALVGCQTTPVPEGTPTVLPSASATPPPKPVLPTETPSITATPTILPTFQPIVGVVRLATNIRTLPNKNAGERIGGLFPNETVQVIGRNDSATWLWIVYESSPSGTGWVTARGIELKGEMGYLPIVIVSESEPTPYILPPFVYIITGTPLPLNLPPAGALTARVNYLTNVRLGPSLGFLSIGTLPPGSIVTLTGRLKSNDWLQIDYPSGPGSRAWISANVLTIDGKPDILPIFNILGTPVAQEDDATQAIAPYIPPVGTLPAGPTGKVLILLNVRTAPTQNSQALGTLKPQTQVVLLGRTVNADWFLIQFATSPNGRAWVAAEFVEVLSGDIASLPVYDEQGNPLGGQP